MSSSSSVSLETRILDLPNCGIVGLGAMTARKLAGGVAEISTDTVAEISTDTFDEILTDEKAVVVIEWAERLGR